MTTTLAGYGASTAAGAGVALLWKALQRGQSLRDGDGVCRFPKSNATTALDRLLPHLATASAEALHGNKAAQDGRRWGVVLASTKGIAEDLVWKAADVHDTDPLTPLLDAFLAQSQWAPVRRLCVSNACVSSHAALLVAQRWLELGSVDDVLLVAADEAREFVASGFRALGALSPTGARPMSNDRDGLQLGEGAAALWLTSRREGPFTVGPVGLETEGLSITRPSPDGGSLVRAAATALAGDGAVDFVVAHGTATPANDLIEARAIARALANVGAAPRTPVTGTKGCVGHTLGASGAVDLIAAAECLRHGALFAIGQTTRPDPELPVAAFYADSPDAPGIAASAPHFRRALVTGLGFGGVHAAMTIAKSPEGR